MNIQERKVNNIILLTLSGRIDAFTAEKLDEELNSIINTGNLHFVVNLTEVSYISSAGLRVFLGAYKKLLKNQGKIYFTNMPEPILKIFSLAGFDKIFEIFTSEREALKQFGAKIEHVKAY
ncbi:MAG: STAS domain-containing protein [Deltaproteobacteria bacterium]|nr:STAS domain-containing protein [Deltaproteobacteria bacterium]